MEDNALSQKSSVSNPAEPVDSRSGAFHLFLYLTTFLSFGFVFFGLTNILFEFFNKNLASDDPLMAAFNQGLVRSAIAFLIIAGPLYYFLLGLINKKLVLKQIDPFSGVRKVLTYLLLFILSAIIIGDLVFLLSSFLNGDYTSLFLAKAVSLLFLAAGFGSFYFWEIRRTEMEKSKFFIWQNGILAVMFLVLVSGFSIIDKPSVAREKRLDGQIINQMSSLRNEASFFYSENKVNPTQEELKNRVSGKELASLENGKIEYQPQESGAYLLCAVFLQAWDGKEIIDGSWNDSFWKHPQGKYCFEIKENLGLEEDGVVPLEKTLERNR